MNSSSQNSKAETNSTVKKTKRKSVKDAYVQRHRKKTKKASTKKKSIYADSVKPKINSTIKTAKAKLHSFQNEIQKLNDTEFMSSVNNIKIVKNIEKILKKIELMLIK